MEVSVCQSSSAVQHNSRSLSDKQVFEIFGGSSLLKSLIAYSHILAKVMAAVSVGKMIEFD